MSERVPDIADIPIPEYQGYLDKDGQLVPPSPEAQAEHAAECGGAKLETEAG